MDALVGRTAESLFTPRGRTCVYVLAVLMLASGLMFWRLGESAMMGDEATYAMEVDAMRASGDWLDVIYAPGHPAFQKPPLYLWLTALTQPVLGESEIGYRAWSAGFAVASVALTAMLGALMFGPETGLLAALILLTNSSYLLNHGARTGTFDTGLSFCFALATLLTCIARNARKTLVLWVATGLFLGLACLLKPLAGVPMLMLLGIFIILPNGSRRFHDRASGLVVVFAIMLLVASPWYIAEVIRHGEIFVDVIFWHNLVARSFTGLDPRALHGRSFYWTAISKSSTFFRLFVPALIYCAIGVFRRRRRVERGMVIVLACGWILLFSISVSKYIHYAYPVFPIIAIAVAALLAAAVEFAARAVKTPSFRQMTKATLLSGLIAVLIFSSIQFLVTRIGESIELYLPWQAFKVLQPAVALARARVAFVGFPADSGDWWPQADVRSEDHFYLRRMQPSIRVDSPVAMNQLLAERRPTLLLLCRSSTLSQAILLDKIRARVDERFCCEEPGLMMCGIDLDLLLHSSIHDLSAHPLLRRISATNLATPGDDSFERSFSVWVDAPIFAGAWVTAEVNLDGQRRATPLLFTATADGAPAAYAVLPGSAHCQRLSVHLPEKSFSLHLPVRVTFQLTPADAGTEAIRGTIQNIVFDDYPILSSRQNE